MCQNNKKHVSLNDNCITSNKNFWRVVKLRVVLRDGGKTISDTWKAAETFTKFYVNIENTLKISKDKRFLVETKEIFDPVLTAVKKYSTHPSILSIKKEKDE